MAALDGAIKSLMQGVSQQVPRERLDGQVSTQKNMISDLVFGMRRRPGMRVRASNLFFDVASWNKEDVFATAVDVQDASVHVLVNTKNGKLDVWNDDFSTFLSGTIQPYLVASSAASIQVATSRGQLFICNTEQLPAKVVDNTGRQNPAFTGFFYIKAGQFSKIYNVTINVAGTLYTATYTTPSGAAPGDAALSTPEAIAQGIVNHGTSIPIPNVNWYRVGAFVFVIGDVPLGSVSTDAGSNFAMASNANRVPQATDLPARLATQADGALCAVGTSDRLAVWYQFDVETMTWNEAGAYNSPTGLSNMPIRLSLDGLYTITTSNYEGRLAGSDTTNEDPAFLTTGITGMGTFQGRLVLLAGPNVVLSASGKPTRFYRSTTVDLLVVDPISVYSGSATSTDFTHCVQFNKDLLLFSKSCQAVIPAGNAAITPTTAQIVITSAYATTNQVAPVVAGRSLLYFSPRSDTHAAVLEIVPSTSTDSQYTTIDISSHLPEYIPGVIRQATASPTTNYVVIEGGDARQLFVYQYLWSADQKVQSAWHDWSAPADIVCTWFVRDTVHIGLFINGTMAVVSVEPTAQALFGASLRRPFSDVYSAVTVTAETFTLPVNLRALYNAGEELQVCFGTGPLAGEYIGIEDVNTTTWIVTLVRNAPDGTYTVGVKYDSQLAPTPPTVRDTNDVVIGTSDAILVRYELTMRNSGTFNVRITRDGAVLEDGEYSGLLYSSSDLSPDQPLYATQSRVIVPVRSPATATDILFSTNEDHDLGLLTIEYVLQYHARRRRI